MMELRPSDLGKYHIHGHPVSLTWAVSKLTALEDVAILFGPWLAQRNPYFDPLVVYCLCCCFVIHRLVE